MIGEDPKAKFSHLIDIRHFTTVSRASLIGCTTVLIVLRDFEEGRRLRGDFSLAL